MDVQVDTDIYDNMHLSGLTWMCYYVLYNVRLQKLVLIYPKLSDCETSLGNAETSCQFDD